MVFHEFFSTSLFGTFFINQEWVIKVCLPILFGIWSKVLPYTTIMIDTFVYFLCDFNHHFFL